MNIKKDAQEKEIQRRVVKYTFVIFFVATVSAAGGFLQGERVALQNNTDTQQASVLALVEERVDRIIEPQIDASDKKNQKQENAQEQEKEKDGEKKKPCSSGSTDPECLDRCTSTFVFQNSSNVAIGACITSNKDPVRKAINKVVAMCSDAGGDWKKVWKAYKCESEPSTESDIGGGTENTISATAALAVTKPSALCTQAKKELGEAIKVSLEKAKKPPKKVDVGSCNLGAVVCFGTVEEEQERKEEKKEEKKESTQKETAAAANAVSSDSVSCCSKFDDACLAKFNKAVGMPTGNTGTGQCTGSISKIVQCEYNKVKKDLQEFAGGLGGRILGGQAFQQPPSGGGGGGGSSTPQSCPSGYSQSMENGRIVCTKEKAAVKPACLIVANKQEIQAGESVTVRWRTANAERVDITDIGQNVPKNEEKILKPNKTTTYTLTATGNGTNNTNTCDVTVTVNGGSGDASGEAPPKLSCEPSTILKGKTGSVKWACTNAAKTSIGTKVNTEGKLGGVVEVTPEHNTEYSVSCLNEEAQEIGKNVCSISVGEPTYDILVYPTQAKRGDRVRVSWGSLFMKSCRVQGPRGFDYVREQGVVITEPFSLDEEKAPNRNIRAAIYNIECESQFGGVFSKDVTVTFKD